MKTTFILLYANVVLNFEIKRELNEITSWSIIDYKIHLDCVITGKCRNNLSHPFAVFFLCVAVNYKCQKNQAQITSVEKFWHPLSIQFHFLNKYVHLFCRKMLELPLFTVPIDFLNKNRLLANRKYIFSSYLNNYTSQTYPLTMR